MRSRESGFTLIEILIVMAIIATLGAAVMAIIPYATEKSRQSTCQNNLRQLGTILVAESTKSWPKDSGAGFLLRLYHKNKQIRSEGLAAFCCPGEELPIEPGSDQHREMFEKVDWKKVPLEEWDDYITNYAARLVRDYPLKRNAEDKQAIACDRNGIDGSVMAHDDGVMVLFSSGTVEFMESDELGFGPDETIMPGPGSPSQLLEPLSFLPQ